MTFNFKALTSNTELQFGSRTTMGSTVKVRPSVHRVDGRHFCVLWGGGDKLFAGVWRLEDGVDTYITSETFSGYSNLTIRKVHSNGPRVLVLAQQSVQQQAQWVNEWWLVLVEVTPASVVRVAQRRLTLEGAANVGDVPLDGSVTGFSFFSMALRGDRAALLMEVNVRVSYTVEDADGGLVLLYYNDERSLVCDVALPSLDFDYRVVREDTGRFTVDGRYFIVDGGMAYSPEGELVVAGMHREDSRAPVHFRVLRFADDFEPISDLQVGGHTIADGDGFNALYVHPSGAVDMFGSKTDVLREHEGLITRRPLGSVDPRVSYLMGDYASLVGETLLVAATELLATVDFAAMQTLDSGAPPNPSFPSGLGWVYSVAALDGGNGVVAEADALYQYNAPPEEPEEPEPEPEPPPPVVKTVYRRVRFN